MRKILSVLATAVLVLQSMGTSLVYAQAEANPSEESAPETAAESVVLDADDGANDDAPELTDVADETPAAEAEDADLQEPEEVAEPAEEEVVAQEPADEATAEEVEEPAEVAEPTEVEPVDEPEAPVVAEPKAEEPAAPAEDAAPVEEEKVEETSALSRVVDTVFSNPLNGYVDGIYVTVEDPLGGLPEGVRMELAPVLEEHVFDLIDSSLDAKVTKVVAVDITFYDANNEKVEPTQPINVKMVAGDMPEATAVVHVEADYNEEKIEVGEANVEEIVDANIDGDTAEFEAESFSIYAIVTYPVLTVNFNKGGEVLKTEYVKAIDTVEDLIFDPGVGTLGTTEVFRGWTTESDYDTSTTGMTIDQVRESIKTTLSSLESNATGNFYAMIFNNYTITYLDENGTVIHTDELFFKGNTAPEYTVNAAYTPKTQDQDFEGWLVVVDGSITSKKYQNGEPALPLTGDLILMADAPRGYWLSFDENGAGASYTASKFIKTNEVTERPTSNPTRFGYTFDDWYTGTGDDAVEFQFNQELTGHTILYAHWNANSKANYTVIIWKQNVAGDDYDFVESVVVKDATVGSTPTAVDTTNGNVEGGTYYGEVGFHFKETDQASKKVATEGNTIVNVYFDRNEITFNFYIYGEREDFVLSNSKNAGNRYVPDGNGGYVQVYLYRSNDKWYRSRECVDQGWFRCREYAYSNEYIGEIYTKTSGSSWSLYESMVGFYGQTLEQNNYTWPTEYDWYANGGNNGSVSHPRTTFLDAFMIPNGDNYENFYGTTAVQGNSKVEFYKQKADKSGYELANEVSSNGNNVSFSISDKYNGFKAHHYVLDNQTHQLGAKDNNGYYATDIGYGNRTLRIYFNREEYTINFMDGVYVGGNSSTGVDLNKAARGQLDEVDGITYGSDISSYNSGGANFYAPEYSGFVFSGWYLDETCTVPYTFGTMPEGGLTVYAKWRQVQYRVFLHPNADDDESLSWGLTESQETSFRVSNGERVDKIDGTRNDYELVGWYKDEDCKVPYNFSEALNDNTVTTAYDKSKPTELDKWGNLSGENINKDVARFRITRELNLYAKWRQILIGAEGINIEYDAGEGINPPKDTTLYSDQSWAIAGAASSGVDNKKFVHWVVQKWNKSTSGFENTDTVVYPGQEFEVLASYARTVENEGSSDENPSYTYTIRLAAVYGDVENQKTTIKYYDGSTLKDEYTRSGDVNEPLTIAAALEKDGYEFIEWNTEPNGTGTGFEAGTGVAADNKDLTDGVNKLYAKWTPHTYVVKFNANGGEGTMGDQNFTYDVEQALTANAFTKIGYEFDGWRDGNDSYTDGQSVKNLTSVNNGEVELVAQWKLVNYTITYDLDEGSLAEGVTNPTTYTVETPGFTLNKPTKEGYTFLGWTGTDLSEPTDTVTIAQGSKGNREYTANWGMNSYTVTINVNVEGYGTVSQPSVTGNYGSEISTANNPLTISGVQVTATPTQSDAQYTYTFENWTSDCGDTLVENCTITGNFKQEVNTYTVTIISNNTASGTVSPTSATLNYGSGITIENNNLTVGDTPVMATPTENDAQYTYTFVGWTNDECGNSVTKNCTITGNFTSTVNSYTIKFVNEDGNELQSSEVAYGETPEYTGEGPTKDADETNKYTFNGWNPEITPVTGPQVYTATYTPSYVEYTVTWLDRDETPLSGATYHYNDNLVKLADPIREGYVFSGWTPALEMNVTHIAKYTAEYFEDKNDNNEDDSTEPHFTVEFLPGDHGTLSGTANYENILSGLTFTQAGIVVPTIVPNSGYKVKTENGGWDKALVTTVTDSGTYIAQYFEDKNDNNVDDNTELVAITFIAGTHLKVNDAESYTTDENLLPGYDQYPAEPNVTADAGYAFSGWTPVYTSGSIISSGNLTFTAESKCAEKYHLDGNVCVSEKSDKCTMPANADVNATYTTTGDYTFNENTQEWEAPTCEKIGCAPNYHPENVSSDGTAGEAGSDLTNGSNDVITVNADAGTTEFVCVSNTTGGIACEPGNVPRNARSVQKTGTGTWNGKTYEGETCPWECVPGYHKDGNECKPNGGGGGGGGSSGGGHPDDDEEIELGGQVSDKCSISGTNLSAEEIEAYLYACENDITTIRDINEARLGDYLNRAEMAKIVSVFATKELGMKPNTSKDCSNFEGSMNGWSKEMRDYMVMSCQLELMGIHTVNYEAIPDFMPAKHVSRAEFGTILSRILWGDKYEGTNANYYFRHLDALKANKIITNIDPTITEYRSWVLLMIYRSVAVIKAGGTRKTESIEQEVTEELQNSTGAVAEIEAATGALIGMPNPASVYCEEQGGTVDLDTSKCKLADGTEVDEWEYYNANHSDESAEAETGTTIGMPNPAAVYCEEQGGTVDLDSGKCKLADGTEVDQWEYYRANNPEAETGDTTD